MSLPYNNAREKNLLTTNEVYELINSEPHWFVRKANGIFFLILALLLCLAWFIRYPDPVNGFMKLSPTPHEKDWYGEMTTSKIISAKIRVGQHVLVKINSHSGKGDEQFQGIINSITPLVTAQDSVLVKIDLQEGLQPGQDNTRFLQNELPVKAAILLENKSLLSRFFGQLAL